MRRNKKEFTTVKSVEEKIKVEIPGHWHLQTSTNPGHWHLQTSTNLKFCFIKYVPMEGEKKYQHEV